MTDDTFDVFRSNDVFDAMFMLLIILFGFFVGIAVGTLVLFFMGIEENLGLIFFGINMIIVGLVVLIIGVIRFLYLFKIVRRE